MNESASSTSATHSSNGDSSNCVGPLLNVETTLAKPSSSARIDFNANAIVDDRDNLPTDCDDGGSDDDSFSSPLRLGKLVIDFDAGCEPRSQSDRETSVSFMSAHRVADPVTTANGNCAASPPSLDTMSKVEHQITNTSGNGLQVKIKRKTLVMKPDGVQQPSPAEGQVNGSANVNSLESKQPLPKPASNNNDINSSMAENGSKKESKSSKQNVSKPSSGKTAKSTMKSMEVSNIKSEMSETPAQFGQQLQGSRSDSPLTMTIIKDANGRKGVAEGVDPYEFNVKVEDKKSVIEPAMKKVKSEKMDCSIDNISSTSFSTSTKVSLQQLTRDVSVETSSVSVATDPDCLGPCDPGSHVVLEGIVWQETNNGLLVVNVTWRGKTYVGTLMDATQHDWAPPIRLSDFATVDIETKTPKGRGAKRGRGQTATPKNDANERRLRNRRIAVATAAKDAAALAAVANADNNANGGAPVASDARRKRTAAEASSANNGANGNDNGEDSSSSLSSVAAAVAPPPAKQSRTAASGSSSSSSSTGSKFFAPDVECAALPPPQFVCSEPGCCKRYQRETALRYHQSSAHPNNASAAAGLQRQSAAVNDSSDKNMDVDKKSAISAGKTASTGGSKPPKVKVFAANTDPSATVSGSGAEANVPMEVSVTSEKGLKSNSDNDGNKFSSSDNNNTKHVSKPAGDVVNDNTTGVSTKPTMPGIQPQASSGTLSKDSQEVKVKIPKGEKSVSSSDKPKAKVAAIKTSAAAPAVPTTPPVIAPARSTMQLVSVTTHSQGPPLPLGNLKPIQPKPTVMGEPSSVNPSLSDLKEMKAKKKKKNKDKDKEREKDRSSKSAASPPASSGEFAKPSATATSPPQVRVIPDSETIVIGSSSAPSTPVSSGRQSPGFLSTSAAQDQQNSKVQSPAYSDISDANDSAPSLEQEGAMDVTVEANLSGNSTDTLPLSPPITVAMGNAADVTAATSRGAFVKGLGADIAQKPYYNQPPSLLPVIPTGGGNASSFADTKLQQQGLKSGFNQSKSTPPLPPANQDLQQRIGGLGGMNPALTLGEGGKRSSEQHPAKIKTPPNSMAGAKLPSTPSSAGSKQYSAGDKSGLPASSARPVGCAYPMHSTPNATAAGAKHERSVSVDGHSRPPPMLISDRDRNSNEDPSKAPRDRSNDSRQILVESVEMRSHMPGSHYQQQQALLAGGSGRVMLAGSGGEHHGDFDGKMASKEPLPRARSEDDRALRVASRDGSLSGPYDSAKSPQSSTPKPVRDVPPPPPLSSTAGGVVPYPFFPGPGFYPMMAAAGPMEGGVVPVSVDPGMYSMFAASQAAAMAAVYRYGMPVVDNNGAISVKVASDKQPQMASPGSSSMSPDARLASTSFDSGDSVPSAGSAGMSSHKMKELKDIANKRAEAGSGSRPSSTAGSVTSSTALTSSTSSSTLLTRPPGALMSPGVGSSGVPEGGARASPPAQRHVHEHVHHVVPSAPPGFPGLPIYPPFGVGALMPPMHPNIAAAVNAAARMARPTVNK